MKRIFENTRLMRTVLLCLTFVVLTVMWRIRYPYFLIWLEGFSYFDTLPDFRTVLLNLPEDLFRYIGAFILQFYADPLLASAIQASLALIFIICLWAVVKGIFSESRNLIWIPYLPLPAFIYYQLSDLTLSRSLACIAVALLVLVLTSLVRIWKKVSVPVPRLMRSNLLSSLILVAAIISAITIFHIDGPLSSRHETVARLEHYAENQQWDKILETVSRQESVRNEYLRKYVMLALSETGRLPEYALSYGLANSDDFVFQNIQEPFCLNFNVMFYKQLGFYNYAIYQIYQQAVQSAPGMSFDSIRQLIDIYLELKDYNLAKKYMDILSHSTCHGKWLEERAAKLESIRFEEPQYHDDNPKYTLISFLPDISAMVDRYPYDHKYADYLLCGVLSQKDGNTFYSVFQIIAQTLYPDGDDIPKLYQEALLLIASHEPEVLQKYKISKEIWDRFVDFTDLMRAGKTTQAKRKYSDTYWAHVY